MGAYTLMSNKLSAEGLTKGRKDMRAVQLTAYGNPVDGLEYADIPEPDAPGPSQVLIGVEFSPINFSDLLVAQGICAPRSQPLSAMKASAAFLP